MRRLFRFLVRSALLGAAGYAIKKVVASRQPVVSDDGWKAVEPPSPVPPAGKVPVDPVVAPEVVEVGDVGTAGEPEVDSAAGRAADEVAAAADAAPVEQAAKKASAKKAAAPKEASPSEATTAKKAPAKKAAAKKTPAKNATAPKAEPAARPSDAPEA